MISPLVKRILLEIEMCINYQEYAQFWYEQSLINIQQNRPFLAAQNQEMAQSYSKSAQRYLTILIYGEDSPEHYYFLKENGFQMVDYYWERMGYDKPY